MKSGIIRRVDQLGRIVLPMDLRKSMKLREGTQLELSVEDDKIILTKYDVGSGIKEVASSILESLPEKYMNFIICDNDSVILTNKNLRIYLGAKLDDSCEGVPFKSFMATNNEFAFDQKYQNRYICSILKDGDRLGFVVYLSSSPIDVAEQEISNFVCGLISRQV